MSESGQSSLELVALAPVVVVVAMAIGQLFAAGAAREAAGDAARAAAMAQLQGGDPGDSARAAVPAWAKDRVKVVVTGRLVKVTIAPRAVLPGVASLLTGHGTADAGPKEGSR